MSAATDEQADIDELLEDLELLDDPVRHALCAVCYPPGTVTAGAPYVGLCGARALRKSPGPVEVLTKAPADACPACVVRLHQPCRECGS